MGMIANVVGYIQEADVGRVGGLAALELRRDQQRMIDNHNETALAKLPVRDVDPVLVRGMFLLQRGEHAAWYRNRLIVFGGTYPQLETRLDTWLRKFEELLRTMAWEEAYVRIEGELLGVNEFKYVCFRDWLGALEAQEALGAIKWERTGTLDEQEIRKLEATTE